MPQKVGTVSRGLIAPIVHAGDDIAAIAVNMLLSAAETEGFSIHDRDILAVTESVVARAQGNYASTDQIAADKSVSVAIAAISSPACTMGAISPRETVPIF